MVNNPDKPILVALGANLPSRFGSPVQTIEHAKDVLSGRGVTIVASSNIWLTAPVPVSDQPWYHNAVVRVETALSPLALLEVLQDIEHEFGRVRTVRNAPRLLDLDLVAYGAEIVDKPELIVPHPRMHKRAFVLRPMREIVDGGWIHPLLDTTLDDMIANLPADQEARLLNQEAA